MNRIGKLYFRYGTMGSAKTALLLTQAYNFEERGMRYLCMKPIIDDREKDNVIRSRIGIERKCEWIYPDTDLYATIKRFCDENKVIFDWILVDESQFLLEQQVDQLARVVDARIDAQGNIVTDGAQVEIGGDDKYVALCRSCWRNPRIESANRNAINFDAGLSLF